MRLSLDEEVQGLNREIKDVLDMKAAVVSLIDENVTDELVGEILAINSNNERKCEECAGCTNWLCDCANTRTHAIDEFSEQLKVELDKKYSFGIENKFKLFNSIDEIKEQMKTVS